MKTEAFRAGQKASAGPLETPPDAAAKAPAEADAKPLADAAAEAPPAISNTKAGCRAQLEWIMCRSRASNLAAQERAGVDVAQITRWLKNHKCAVFPKGCGAGFSPQS